MSNRALFCGLAVLTLAACGGGGGGGGNDGGPGGPVPPPVTRTIGGSVSGLVGSVTLQNNGVDDLTVDADGDFTFATSIANGAEYSVTVSTQPAGQTCTVTNGAGTATANVTNVAVECVTDGPLPTYTIGGTVTGLLGTLTLQNNAADDLIIDSDGAFAFDVAIEEGSEYAVTVASQPAGQTCTLANASGTAEAAVTNVAVTCTTDPPALALTLQRSKIFRFTWETVPDGDYYQLLEDPTGSDGYTQIGDNLPAGSTSYEHVVPLYARANARYMLSACNDAGCIDSAVLNVSGTLAEAVGYFKASNTGTPGQVEGDYFGTAVALSADGLTMAVGAVSEDSNATGVDGEQDNDASVNSGAVYVFTRANNLWSQQAYLKASNTGAGDNFGVSVALSADGSVLVVGADMEDSNATGVNGTQSNNSAGNAGAAYVFTRSGETWSQHAYLKASNTDGGDRFGKVVAVAGNGNTIAVSAPAEESAATGVNGDQTLDLAVNAGAVYVFARSGSTWTQQAYVKHFGDGNNLDFGSSLALTHDGSTLAVGVPGDHSAQEGVSFTADYSVLAATSGAVSIYTRSGSTWSPHMFVKPSNTEANDRFGSSVALSSDGLTLAVGAPEEDGGIAGINGDDDDNSASGSGAVYVFIRDATFVQHAYIKSSNPSANDRLGFLHNSLALSSNGFTLVAGTFSEDGTSLGINGAQNDDGENEGAVYAFRLEAFEWSQQAYIKPPVTPFGDDFGGVVALSGDGATLAVGDRYEDSAGTGVNGDLNASGANASGCVFLY